MNKKIIGYILFVLSFLMNYKTINENQTYFKNLFTPNNLEIFIYDPPFYNNIEWNYLYNKINLGLTGSFGIKGFISDKLSYSSNIRYDYDLSNSGSFFNMNDQPVQKVNNLNIGLDLGIQFHYEKFIKFNKNPK